MSRNIVGDINCKGCGANVNGRYWMCDREFTEEEHNSQEWCDKCWADHPCGKGEHGEGCPTLVMNDALDGERTTALTAEEWTPERKRAKAHGQLVRLGVCDNCGQTMVPPSGRCINCGHGPLTAGAK